MVRLGSPRTEAMAVPSVLVCLKTPSGGCRQPSSARTGTAGGAVRRGRAAANVLARKMRMAVALRRPAQRRRSKSGSKSANRRSATDASRHSCARYGQCGSAWLPPPVSGSKDALPVFSGIGPF